MLEIQINMRNTPSLVRGWGYQDGGPYAESNASVTGKKGIREGSAERRPLNLWVRPARQRDTRIFPSEGKGCVSEEVVRACIPGSVWISSLLQERASDGF